MGKWTKRVLAVVLAMAMLCGIAAIGASAAEDITAKFTDANFRAAVYEAIGKEAPASILDTDVAGMAQLNVSYKNITRLDGLEYFTGLKYFYCSINQLTELPELPSGLISLRCSENQLKELPELPSSLEYLYCSLNKLTQLPALPSSLKALYCDNEVDGKGGDPINYDNYNKLTSLPTLPPNLEILNCSYIQLTSLPALPASLQYLNCGNNQLTSLPTLLSSLTQLYCQNNQLTSLPALPSSLTRLYCQNNQLALLPLLPPSLKYLNCNNNKLKALNVTSLSLTGLDCSYNNMTSKANVVGFAGIWNDQNYTFDPQNTQPNEEPAPFWSTWPPFLVSILEYVLFGWLWMRWF